MNGRFVYIRVSRRGQGASLFSVFEEKHQVHMDQGMRRVVSQVERILGQPTSIMQATTTHPASLVLRSHRSGDQFGPRSRAGSGVEADIFRKQSFARA